MRLWRHKTPALLRGLYPSLTWHESREVRQVYLTFDDGPTLELCQYILDTLATFNAKATFFCVGDNLRKHPAFAEAITQQGHRLANHTYNHIKGWQHTHQSYLSNVKHCESYLQQGETKLFRPPYGQIKRSQITALQKMGYKIVMWDVLSGDFDRTIDPASCLEGTMKATRSGSIIVFHDNVKSAAILKKVLPNYLRFLADEGYQTQIWK